MADTKISVIVPVYKVEPYLRRCLESIVGQTYKNLEIIIVDDGSPDSCGAICDEYAAKDERIKVIHKANGGVSSARNAGLAAATGDYIGWVDSDDWIETDMFDYLLDGARGYDADVAVCGRIEAYPDHQRTIGWERKTVLSRNEAIGYLLEDGVLRNYLCDKLWRRELFHDIVFPEGKTFEDTATVYRLLEKANKVVCLPECKYFYLQREDGIVHSRNLRNVMNCYEAEKERYLYLRGSCPEFQPQMERDLVLAAARIWEVYLMDSAGNRRQYKNQLEEMAAFAREHPSAVCDAGQSLGLAGKLLLRLTKHAAWWAYIMAGFTGWVYRCKRRWFTRGGETVSGQVKISVIIPERYREYGDLCRRLDHIVSETATGLEIIYPPDTSGGELLQIQHHDAFGCHFEEEIITRKRFECYCRQADVVSILRELCGAQNTLAENEGVLSALTAWFAEECVRLWHSSILPEDREWANACLRQHFDDKLLLAAMAKQYWDTPEEIARRFGRIKSSELKGKNVRTIGIFNYQMWNGGTDRVISTLVPMYEEMGYRVVVITMEGPTEKDFPLSPGIPHLQITGTRETFSGNLDARLDQWDALIKEYSIDLMIYHPWTLHLLVWDALFLKLQGVSVVFQTHSVFSFLLAEGKREFSLLPSRLSLGDGISVTCKVDKIFWNCFHENVHYILNPIQPELMRAKRSSGGQNKIVWIGRVAPEKRPLDAIRIMEYVVRQCPDAMLYMVGGGHRDTEEQCRQAVAEKGLGSHVVFTGAQKNVYQYLESASVLVIVSLHEGYSMALLEAMAHGVPVVMYDKPYLNLCRSDYGVLGVEESNHKQAAAEVCRLLKDPAAWQRASQAAIDGFAEVAAYDYRGAWERLISGEISPSTTTEEVKIMMRAVVDHYLLGWGQVPTVSAAPPAVSETAFTWMKRKFRGVVSCLQTHGVRYTARRVIDKVLAKLGRR